MDSTYNYQNVKKLGLGIIAFEGTEHLYNIISEIKDFLGYVVVGIQDFSYHGDPIDPTDKAEVVRLKNEDGLVDKILSIKFDLKVPAREQETAKRNILLDELQKNGCTHAIIIDSDEFYTRSSFEKALQKIDQNDYELTYCEYINYYHDYKHYLVYPFAQGMYVPFVTKIKYRFTFNNNCFPLPSDPTRRYYTGKVNPKNYPFHLFKWDELKMHHFSWIRANIVKKAEDWSSKKCFENYEDLIDKAIYTYNKFDSNSEGTKKVNILFNTPENQVEIESFPRQYVFPKIDINTRLRFQMTKPKILILSMSSSRSPFITQEAICKSTWAKPILEGKYPNIDYWIYRESKTVKKTTIIKNKHLILVPEKNHKEVYETASKTIEVFNIIDKIGGNEYDWVVRTNTSSFINVPLLEAYLSRARENDLYIRGSELTCFWWSGKEMYVKGACMIWSKRNFAILRSLCEKYKDTLDTLEHKKYFCDDVIFSLFFNSRYFDLGIDHSQMYKCFGQAYLMDPEIKEGELNKDLLKEIVVQVKNYYNDGREQKGLGRNTEGKKMKEVNDYFEKNWDPSMIPDALAFLDEKTNKEGICVTSVDEWRKRPIQQCYYRWMFNNDMKPFNDIIDAMIKEKIPYVSEESKIQEK